MRCCIVCIALLLPISTTLAQSKFGIRKTYDGSSKDENKPASGSYSRDFEAKKDVYTVDLGVKFTELELLPNKSAILTLIPKGEYHSNKKDTFNIHSLSGGINVQFQPAADNTPWILGSVDYQGDFVKETEVVKTKAYISFISTKGIRPCLNILNQAGALVFRYFPYLGYENYRSTDAEIKGMASFFTARVYVEFVPFPASDLTKLYFLCIFDFSYRWRLDDELYENKDLTWVAPTVVYYPTGEDKFGIGLDYSAGYDPVSNFGKVNRLTLSLKVKI